MGVVDKARLRADLRTGASELVYRKKDNTVRTVRATLSTSYVPEEQHEALQKSLDDPRPEYLTVWDLRGGWRTLIVDEVISAQGLAAYY